MEWGLLAATGLLWGSAYLLIDAGLESLPPLIITLARLVLGLALLSCVARARRGRIARTDWPRVALLGLFWLALPLTLFPVAQQWVSSAVAGMLTGAQPLFSAAIAALLLARMPPPLALVGLGVGFVGVGAIALSSTRGGSSSAAGVALILVAVLSYSLSTNLAVPLQQRYGSLPVILRALAVSVVLVAPAGLVELPGTSASEGSLAAVAVLGLVCTGVAYVAFATLVGRAGATRGAVAIYLVPVVALALGVAFRGDRVTAPALTGIALVLLGAWLTSRWTPRPGVATRAAGLGADRSGESHPSPQSDRVPISADPSGPTRTRT